LWRVPHPHPSLPLEGEGTIAQPALAAVVESMLIRAALSVFSLKLVPLGLNQCVLPFDIYNPADSLIRNFLLFLLLHIFRELCVDFDDMA
jgi:hypothetical protein